jgi:hypothetical protein
MRTRTTPLWLLLVLLSAILLSGCAIGSADASMPVDPALSEPDPVDYTGGDVGDETTDNWALIDEIEIEILESLPVQVRVIVRGYFNDAITVLDIISQSRVDDDTIAVRILTTRDPDAMGAQVLVPFEESIALDIVELGLEPGTYTVDVNGVTQTLTLDAGMLGM